MPRQEIIAIARLAWPNLISFGAQLAMLSIDGAVAARMGPRELAAVALTLPFQMLLVQSANGAFGAATAGAVARAVGAGNAALVKNVAAHALLLASMLGLGLALGGGLSAHPLIAAVGGSGAALTLATAYAQVLFIAAIPVWINGALTGIARGARRMWLPTGCLCGAALIHLVLAPSLVFGYAGLPALGLPGLAWSFMIAYAATIVPLGWSALSNGLVQRFLPRRIERPLLSGMLYTAGLAVLTTCLSNLSVMLSTRLVSVYGPDILAGYGLAARLEYVVAPLVFSVGTALITLCGQARGAGQQAAARRYAMTGVWGCALIVGVFGSVLAIWPSAWIHLFAPPEAIGAAAHDYLRVAGFAYGFFGAGLTAFFACQAFGDMRRPLIGGLLRIACIVAGGLIAIRHADGGPTALYLVLACGFAAYGINNLLAIRAVSRVTPPARNVEEEGLVSLPANSSGR